MHEGHRQRMLEKLASESTLQDHELLEILLFYAIPRKNTNEIAHSLIDACGGLGNVFRADVGKLASVNGVGKSTAAYLKTIGAVFGRVNADAHAESSQMIFSYHDFSAYIAERYKNAEEEILELFAVDGKNKIVFAQSYSTGDRDRVALGGTDVSRFISAHGPKGVVIAHSHPSAPATPSAQDDDFTRLAYVVCSINNVALIDHVIVGTDGAYSYYLTGELEKIRDNYNIETMMRRARNNK